MNTERILIFLKTYTVYASYYLLKLLYKTYPNRENNADFHTVYRAMVFGAGCGISCLSLSIIYDWDLLEFFRPFFDFLSPFFSFAMQPLDPLKPPYDFLILIPPSDPLKPPIDFLISMSPSDSLKFQLDETNTLHQYYISNAQTTIQHQEELKNAKSARLWLIPAIAVACACIIIDRYGY